MAWPINYTPMSQAHTPVLTGYASTSTGLGGNTVAVAVDPTNGAILTEVVSGGGGGGGNVNLTQVGGATYALGQTTASGSMPVVINSDTLLSTAANQATEITSLSSIATNTANSATSANQTNGTQQSKITNGTNVADVVAGDTGFNGVAGASATKTYTFTTSSSGAQTILANTPTEGFNWIEIIYTSVGSGLALTAQYAPNSGGTYITSNTFPNLSVASSGNVTIGTTVNTIYGGPIHGNYFQLNVTALTSGTFSGYVILRGIAPPMLQSYATQSSTWNVGSSSATGSAVPANAFYMGLNDGTLLVGAKDVAGAGTTGATTGILASSLSPVVNNNGLLKSKTICAASTNATSVKASAGNVYKIKATNSDTVGYYLKMYNKASAPTVGTDTPVDTMYIPPGGGLVDNMILGSPYTTGIAFATTLLATDADTTVVTNANKLVINVEYI